MKWALNKYGWKLWNELTWFRDQFWALVSTVNNLQVPKAVEKLTG